MTERLYYKDAYKTEFSAVVTGRTNDYVILDKTYFYPKGGGQPGDIGFLGDAPVTDCRIKNGEIVHIADNRFQIGQEITGRVNFLRRYGFMQNHTGEHIVSGIVSKRYGFENVGFHLSANSMTFDFNGEIPKDELDMVEDMANDAVYQNIAIETNFMEGSALEAINYRSKKQIDGPVRLVNIEGFDTCACAGLHVMHCGEVGIIKIVSAQRYKGGTRLLAVCGRDALHDYRQKNESVLKISALLSAKPHDISAGVEDLLAAMAEQRKITAGLRSEIFSHKAGAIAEGTPFALFFEEGLSADEARRFAYEAASRANIAFVFCSAGDKPDYYKYAICSRKAGANIAKIAKDLNEALNGRGGSSNEISQGAVNASKSSIEQYIKNRGEYH